MNKEVLFPAHSFNHSSQADANFLLVEMCLFGKHPAGGGVDNGYFLCIAMLILVEFKHAAVNTLG